MHCELQSFTIHLFVSQLHFGINVTSAFDFQKKRQILPEVIILPA